MQRTTTIQARLTEINQAKLKLTEEEAALKGELETLEGKKTENDDVYFEVNHTMKGKPAGYPEDARDLIDALAKMKSLVKRSSGFDKDDLTARYYPNNAERVSFSIGSTTGTTLTDLFYKSIKDCTTQSKVKGDDEFGTRKTIVTFTFSKSELKDILKAVNLLLDSKSLSDSYDDSYDHRRGMLC